MKKQKKEHYSVTEVAAKEKLPYYTIIRKIKKGYYPNAYKVGHGWVIPAGDIK